MATLSELLPALPKKTRNRYAAALRKAGFVSPCPLGDGMAYDYSAADCETIRRFADLIAAGRSTAEAVRELEPACPGSSRVIPGHGPGRPGSSSPGPAQESVTAEAPRDASAPGIGETPAAAQLAAQIARLEAETATLRDKAAEAERRQAETAARAEAERRTAEDRAAAVAKDAKAARDAAQLAAEEASNHRARIARLEDTIRKGRPAGILARFRAALDVLLGRAAAVPALPAPKPSEEIRKAA